MRENDRYKAAIKNLCENFQKELVDCGLFDDRYIKNKQRQMEEKIMPLLKFEKPKIMVYGIYNGGKSTLVNAICRKEVAQVADRPMTDCITEYDAGKYILVDSPGVNAPIQHEKIADANLEGCHMILFVISSKGLFEDKVNYQKMGDLIQKRLPFYIILNERAQALPPKEKKEERKAEIQKRENALNGIKRKIISNLAAYSGVPDVKEKYEMITLNAKRAWTGIERQNEALIRESRISDLLGRIDSILEGKGALKQLLAPLSAIEQMIGETERDIIVESGNEAYAVRREILQKKIMNFREDFLSSIRDIAERYFNDLYNRRLGRGSVTVEYIWDEVCREVKESYKNKIFSLVRYMRESFPEISFEPDTACNLETLTFGIKEEFPVPEDKEEFQKTSVYVQRQKENVQNENNILEAAKNVTGIQNLVSPFVSSLVPPIDPICIGLGLEVLGTVLNFFQNKKEKAAQEEKELQEAIERDNQKVKNQVEEDIRRRKEARTYANAKIDEMVREIRLRLQDTMNQEFNRMIDMLDHIIEEKDRRNDAIGQFMDKCKENRSQIAEIRKEIG